MTHVNINLQGRILDPVSEVHHINGYRSFHNGVDTIHNGIGLQMEPEHRNGTSFSEIADHRQMIQRLEESENKLRNFVSQSFEGILMFDQQGHITEWNPAIEKITGIPKKKALGCSIWDVMWQLDPEETRTPQRKDVLQKEMLDYMDDGENEHPVVEERALLATTGRTHYVRMSTFPLKLSAGVCHFGCIMRDITRQRWMEIELNRYRANFEQMVKVKIQELTVANEKTGVSN